MWPVSKLKKNLVKIKQSHRNCSTEITWELYCSYINWAALPQFVHYIVSFNLWCRAGYPWSKLLLASCAQTSPSSHNKWLKDKHEHWLLERKLEVFPGQVFSLSKQVSRARGSFSRSCGFFFTRNKLSEMFWASSRCWLGASRQCAVPDKTKRIERIIRKGCFTWNTHGSDKTPRYLFGHVRLSVGRKRLVSFISQIRSCWSWCFRRSD